MGRRFVPIGTLNNNWNLIFWACRQCNRNKSDLEDDISAITMHFHASGLPQMADSRAQAEAKRKSTKSISRNTGKPVIESSKSLKVRATGLIGEMTVDLTAPPQVDDARAYELARLQMIGFFYFLTYDQAKNIGHYWEGGFYPLHVTIKSDWGNPVHRAFMNEIASWDYRQILTTAGGYYQAMIRRHPTKACWSWAVEWNDCYRLVGFFGDLNASKAIADKLPGIQTRSIIESSTSSLRFQIEKPLKKEDDILFRLAPNTDDQTTNGSVTAR